LGASSNIVEIEKKHYQGLPEDLTPIAGKVGASEKNFKKRDEIGTEKLLVQLFFDGEENAEKRTYEENAEKGGKVNTCCSEP
jgi:hypothetical protein